jgi:hypothetical protein
MNAARKWGTNALLIATVVTLVMLATGWGSAVAATVQSVLITNGPGRPVPVKVASGALPVSGSVGISGTPSVKLDPTGNTVHLASGSAVSVSGTPSVSISGTPSVSVSNFPATPTPADIGNFVIPINNPSGNTACVPIVTPPSNEAFVVTQAYNAGGSNYVALAVGGCASSQWITPSLNPFSASSSNNNNAEFDFNPGFLVPPNSTLDAVIGGTDTSGNVLVNGYYTTP